MSELLRTAPLYLVCGTEELQVLDPALRGGVRIVQLRVKGADARQSIVESASYFRRLCTRHRALLIINDHAELVERTGADGVHLGQDDMQVERARELLGPDRVIGLSTHSPEQIDAAGDQPVDYIGVGPVFATPTKPGRPAVGVELVGYAAEHARMPFFAIGGITPDNVDAVRDAGAHGVAVVRALTEADDPFNAAMRLAQGAQVGAT